MDKERLTYHSGYRNAMGKAYNAKHNDREGFEKPKSDTQNVYKDYCASLGGTSFSENEKLFYSKFFSPHVKRQNDKYKKKGNYDRVTSVETYRSKHPPEEVLLYIGRKNVDPDILWRVFEDFNNEMVELSRKSEFSAGVTTLNAALHLDETTPHIQFRRVFWYRDADGNRQVSQNTALERFGFWPLGPDGQPLPRKKTDKKNNPKVLFQKYCRERLFEIAKSYGVELETEPLPKDEVGLPLKEYIQREQAREAAAAEQQAAQEVIAGLQSDIADLEEDKTDVADELKRLRKSVSRENAALEEKRNKIIDKAKEEAKQLKEQAWELGAKEGAASAMGQLNRRLREKDEEQEGFEHEGR